MTHVGYFWGPAVGNLAGVQQEALIGRLPRVVSAVANHQEVGTVGSVEGASGAEHILLKCDVFFLRQIPPASNFL